MGERFTDHGPLAKSLADVDVHPAPTGGLGLVWIVHELHGLGFVVVNALAVSTAAALSDVSDASCQRAGQIRQIGPGHMEFRPS